MIDQPVKKILHWIETFGKILKWAVDLSEFDIKFILKTAIEAHVLANFIVELTISSDHPRTTESDLENLCRWVFAQWRIRSSVIMIGPKL